MTNNRLGKYYHSAVIAGESYRAYIPAPLPPDPPIDMARLYPLIDKATAAIGCLDGMITILPDASLFLYMYVRKEAVLSSQIEGTQSSLSDLLMFEYDQVPGAPMDDVNEVSCYVAALNHGMERLSELPLSLRLLKEMHACLMNNTRGSHKQPGEFRTTQNWVGGTRPGTTRFVPPPPSQLMMCLGSFEKFFHDESVQVPALVKAALAHLQFETIHPFLDGNGRLGRLLITLILCVEGILREPLLYLSLYLKTHRNQYYELLQSVRETGNWEDWIEFFLEGVIETSGQATETAQLIVNLFKKDRSVIKNSNRSTSSALAIHVLMQHRPILTTGRITMETGSSLPTVLRNLAFLEDLDIVKEITGKQRNKIFTYKSYLEILNQGTELLLR